MMDREFPGGYTQVSPQTIHGRADLIVPGVLIIKDMDHAGLS